MKLIKIYSRIQIIIIKLKPNKMITLLMKIKMWKNRKKWRK